MKGKQVLFFLVAVFLWVNHFTILSSAYDKGEVFQAHDWRVHVKYYHEGVKDDYPEWVYWFYPGSLKMIFFHAFLLIPLMLGLFSVKLKTSPWAVVSLYFIFGVDYWFVVQGFLKQTILTEAIMLWFVTSVFLKGLRKKAWFSLLPAIVIANGKRAMNYPFSFFIYRLNDLPAFLLNGYSLGFLGLLTVSVTLWCTRSHLPRLDWWFLLGLFFLSVFEVRVLLTLLVLVLPFFWRVVETAFGRKSLAFLLALLAVGFFLGLL